MTAEAEFGQRPFAAGSLTGLRTFRITDAGALTGVVHKGLWGSGVNQAECLAPSGIINFLGGRQPLRGPDAPGHQLASLNCTCGWHAYFDGSNDYASQRWIMHNQYGLSGVIEGWGKCVVGSRGFRCEKAQIKALVVPQGHTEWPDGLLQTVRDRYPVLWFDNEGAALHEFPLTNAWKS